MKKVITLLLVTGIGTAFIQANKKAIKPTKVNKVVELKPKQVELNIKVETPTIAKPQPISLVEAIIMVESRGNDSAIGDRHIVGGEAVGCLQIRPIMLKEINRQLKRRGLEPRFELEDRYSRSKSIEMFNVYVSLLHEGHSDEHIARNWNGGPKGYKRKSTGKYWSKVQREMVKDLALQD
tara:strand:- start:1439 stop:1978 length:540 start_codon:yes stop_codon:yes gene_type:complete